MKKSVLVSLVILLSSIVLSACSSSSESSLKNEEVQNSTAIQTVDSDSETVDVAESVLGETDEKEMTDE